MNNCNQTLWHLQCWRAAFISATSLFIYPHFSKKYLGFFDFHFFKNKKYKVFFENNFPLNFERGHCCAKKCCGRPGNLVYPETPMTASAMYFPLKKSKPKLARNLKTYRFTFFQKNSNKHTIVHLLIRLRRGPWVRRLPNSAFDFLYRRTETILFVNCIFWNYRFMEIGHAVDTSKSKKNQPHSFGNQQMVSMFSRGCQWLFRFLVTSLLISKFRKLI